MTHGRTGLSIGLLTLLALSFGIASQAQGADPADMRDFMRAKLRHSQNVLEGLVLADYDKIAKGAQEMSLLSLAETWQVLQTPEYVDYSRKFRVEADALAAAAKQGKLDQATAAYNKLTTRCVECHKYVRDVRMAELPQVRETKLVRKLEQIGIKP